MLLRIGPFLLLEVWQVERDKFQFITLFLAQPDRHMMPGQVASKGLYDAVANFTRLEQAAYGQSIFINSFQFGNMTAGFELTLFPLGNILLDANIVCNLFAIIQNGRNRYRFPV